MRVTTTSSNYKTDDLRTRVFTNIDVVEFVNDRTGMVSGIEGRVLLLSDCYESVLVEEETD